MTAIGLAAITITGYVGTTLKSKETEAVVETKIGTKIGDEAPNISMNNPDGVEMKLSDLRGKIVWLTFGLWPLQKGK